MNGTIEQYCIGQTWPTELSPLLVEVGIKRSMGTIEIKDLTGALMLLDHLRRVCVVGDSHVFYGKY